MKLIHSMLCIQKKLNSYFNLLCIFLFFFYYLYTKSNKLNKPMASRSYTSENNLTGFNVENKRTVCWKLQYRGLYGESLLHILIICNTKTHTHIAKQLLNAYPSLANDIFENEEY